MKVLITDPDPASAAALRNAMNELGHVTALANDMPAIWAVLHESDDPLIAIIDCSAYGLEGLDVFRNIRATIKTRGVYLILLTSSTEPTFIAEAIEAGANNYIRRTTEQADLRICIDTARRMLELEEALTPRSTRDTVVNIE
jgi:PleD family two-component response regulator